MEAGLEVETSVSPGAISISPHLRNIIEGGEVVVVIVSLVFYR